MNVHYSFTPNSSPTSKWTYFDKSTKWNTIQQQKEHTHNPHNTDKPPKHYVRQNKPDTK